MKQLKILIVLLLASVFAQAQTRQQQYTWIDFHGKIRFDEMSLPKLPSATPDSNSTYFYDGHLYIWEGIWKEISTSGGNNFTDSIYFDTATGIFYNWRFGMDSLHTSFDGRYLKLSDTSAAFSKFLLKPTGGTSGIISINSSNDITVVTPTYLTRDSIINGAGVYNFHYPLYKTAGTNDVWIDRGADGFNANAIHGITIATASPHNGDVPTYNASTNQYEPKPTNGGIVIGFTPASSTDNQYPIGTAATDDSYFWYRTSSGTWKKIALITY